MKRVAATSAYVRAWLPSVWKRVLQRLLQFLLQLSMLPRRLMITNSTSDSDTTSIPKRKRWLMKFEDTDDADTDNQVEVGESKISSAWSSAADASGRMGLVNTGNTCFVNAVIQCLLAIPGFTSTLSDQVQRILDAEEGDAENNHVSTSADDRKKQMQRMRLAMALLDLLEGLSADDKHKVDPDLHGTGRQSPNTERDTDLAHDSNAARETMPQENDHESKSEASRHANGVATPGKKRKRTMATCPSDYTAAAHTKRLKVFLDATSDCTDLVAGSSRRQDQQDAEELLLVLLDTLHEALRVAPDNPSISHDQNTTTTRLLELNKLVDKESKCLDHLKKCIVTEPGTYNQAVCYLGAVRWQRYLMDNQSFITDMFTGQTVRGSQCCSCANLTCLHQEFRVLWLSIDTSKASQTIEECLENHRRLEDLTADNQVFCDGHCKDKTNRHTQVLIQRAPETLVIQLQRFKHSNWRASPEKIATNVMFPVDCPLELTANMFMRDVSRPVLYELQAVCSHIGSALDAGHYIAYVREPLQETPACDDNTANSPPSQNAAIHRWTKYDDDFVTVMDEHTFQRETKSTAYMLFYTRIHREVPVVSDTDVGNETIDTTSKPDDNEDKS